MFIDNNVLIIATAYQHVNVKWIILFQSSRLLLSISPSTQRNETVLILWSSPFFDLIMDSYIKVHIMAI